MSSGEVAPPIPFTDREVAAAMVRDLNAENDRLRAENLRLVDLFAHTLDCLKAPCPICDQARAALAEATP